MRILGDGETLRVDDETMSPGLRRHREERGDFTRASETLRNTTQRNLAYADVARADVARADRHTELVKAAACDVAAESQRREAWERSRIGSPRVVFVGGIARAVW